MVMTTLYAVGSGVGDGSSNLYRISNFASAPAAVNIGETGTILTDLAINPRTGLGYAISFTTLYRIDLNSAGLTRIGALGVTGMNALTFTPDGTLYAMSGTDTHLFRVDISTGHTTSLLDTGNTSGGDLVADSNSSLYLSTGSKLVRINLSSRTTQSIGLHGFSNIFGLAVDSSGNLYGASGVNGGGLANFFRINKNTGAASLVGAVASASMLGMYGLST